MAPAHACPPLAPTGALGCECGAVVAGVLGAAGAAGAGAAFAFAVPPAAALAGAGEAAGLPCPGPGLAAWAALAFGAAAAACDAAALGDAAGVPLDAPAAAEAAGAAGSAFATAPVASRGGTFNVAPSFNRLGSPRMNADGFASKIALAARPSTVLSCDCVTKAAISASDCPGLTVYTVAAEPAGAPGTAGAEAGAAAGAAQAGDASVKPARASQAQAIASGTARRVERFVMEVSRALERASIWQLGVSKDRSTKQKRRRGMATPFVGSYAS